MTEFVLAVYDREDTAQHVLGLLQARPSEQPVDLSSVGIVRVSEAGVVTIVTTDRPGTGESFWGILWEALFGLIFLVPAARTAYGANLGALFGAIDRAGLDDQFRTRVRLALGPGGSGLAFLAIGWSPALVFDHLYLRPDSLLQVSLSPAQHEELIHELGGSSMQDNLR